MNVYEQRLRAVLSALQDYLPPGGPSAHDTLTLIIGLVDPWPAETGPVEGSLSAPAKQDKAILPAASAAPVEAVEVLRELVRLKTLKERAEAKGPVAELPDGEPFTRGADWKLHRCADGEPCRAEIGGGCGRGWCAHFKVKPSEDTGKSHFPNTETEALLEEYERCKPAVWDRARTLVAQPPQAVQEDERSPYFDMYVRLSEACGYPHEKDTMVSPEEHGAELLKDAKRYRWLRDRIDPREVKETFFYRGHNVQASISDATDAAVDAAISVTTKEN